MLTVPMVTAQEEEAMVSLKLQCCGIFLPTFLNQNQVFHEQHFIVLVSFILFFFN